MRLGLLALQSAPRKLVVSLLGDDVAASRVRDIFRSNLDRLLAEKRAAGVDAKTIAARMGIGATKLSQWRIGEAFPRPEQIDRIAEALGVKAESLFRENVIVETRDLDAAIRELAALLGYRLSKDS
jgi:transcriptional regulator with XRE-family HTH domain